ncbi:LexA family protein [Adlercreutzia sp. ZJ141]|uniref:LexA family protein n=1 Tax=Adlercreutzia sp. ZJ141 TaxID=2709406 RepID=UPI001F153C6E|nr:S24 family peptidase [Adlercreutzia sp. ZJ141]
MPVSGMAMGHVPLLGRVHAGKPNDPDEFDGETALIPQFLIDEDPDTYACLSEGDCMNRVYPEGCLIAISPNREPQNGSVAVVTIDGRDAVMRRMYRTTQTLVLSPDSFNPEHEDIVIRATDDHIIEFGGRVVWFQSKDEME